MDVSAFQRVLVAGFIGGGTEDVDANLETVRLLRSQLRSKSTLRVIEAEALPLAELAIKQVSSRRANGPAQEGGAEGSAIAAGSRSRGREQEPRSSATRRISSASRASSPMWRSGSGSARNTRTR